MKNISSLLGTQIRKVRKKCGLTIEALSEKAEISPVFLSDVERGKKEASVTTLHKIAKALGVKVSYLLKPLDITQKTSYKRETIEILSDEPTKEILAMLEGRSVYQIKTASRVLKGLFEEEEKEKKK